MEEGERCQPAASHLLGDLGGRGAFLPLSAASFVLVFSKSLASCKRITRNQLDNVLQSKFECFDSASIFYAPSVG